MTKEEYKKLNNHLNDIFLELEKKDSFLLENLYFISMISEDFTHFIKQFDFKEDKLENNLSYEDVYSIAREIIASFNEDYLIEYDKILNDGTLDFNYDKDKSGCWFRIRDGHKMIDIEREFNYVDVVNLIHEFIHYTNGCNKMTINRYLLTEFLSIYFEIYAQKYLLEHYNVPKETLGIYFRIEATKRVSNAISWYSIPFYAFLNNGSIDENSYQFTNEYFIKESKESFENECKTLLDKCEKAEQRYRRKILYEKEFNDKEFINYLVYDLGLTSHYRYLLGTVLAYYATSNVDIKNIISLNNFINSEESANMSVFDLLLKFGIDLDNFADKDFSSKEEVLKALDNFTDKAFSNMEEVLRNKEKTR